jgi:hypothetical protein
MKEPVQYSGIEIMKATSPCCNHCRFCSVGQKTFHNISFERYERIVERFLSWKEEKAFGDFFIRPEHLYTAATTPVEQLARRRRLRKRGGETDFFLVQMNGLVFMPDDELRDCLLAKKAAEITRINLSFAGKGKLHDTWVGRRGEYEFLLRIAKIAADIGLPRQERLFLTKSAIPHIEPLMDVLDQIPQLAERLIFPLGYIGWAKNLEEERITKRMLEQLPERVLQYYDAEHYKTEGEWIESLRSGNQKLFTNKKTIRLPLREDNLDEIEEKSCDEIVTELIDRYNKIDAVLPGMFALAEMYGDIANTRIYHPSSLDRKWTQHYLKDHPQISMEDYQIANYL